MPTDDVSSLPQGITTCLHAFARFAHAAANSLCRAAQASVVPMTAMSPQFLGRLHRSIHRNAGPPLHAAVEPATKCVSQDQIPFLYGYIGIKETRTMTTTG